MSLQQTLEKIISKRSASVAADKKRRLILRVAGAFLLLVVALYFVRQFNFLRQGQQVGLTPPPRNERLDTTGSKPAALTKVYEQEEKNRHQDSLALAREDKALQYIVMDWENLYDVRKKQALSQPPAESHTTDSLAALLKMLKAKDSSRAAVSPTVVKRNGAVKPMKGKPNHYRSGSPIRKADKQENDASASLPTDPFNTVRASDYAAASNLSSPAFTPPASPGRVRVAREPASRGIASELIPAVVHGENKIMPGSKVTFRTLKEAYVHDSILPKNTLVTAIADLGKGRITFSNFRAKVAGTDDTPAGVLLSMNCYDPDLVAGISYQDQSAVEAELGRGTISSLTNAVGDLSSSIPFSSLARASSTLARGAIRGAARSRQQFIYLSDGYKVFLEPQSLKQ
jgi:hypothetical protein